MPVYAPATLVVAPNTRFITIVDHDLLSVLFEFGGLGGAADVNGDGIVDDADLLNVLFDFGSGC